jgi:hypothetical protein
LPLAADELPISCQDIAKKLPFAAICCHSRRAGQNDQPIDEEYENDA